MMRAPRLHWLPFISMACGCCLHGPGASKNELPVVASEGAEKPVRIDQDLVRVVAIDVVQVGTSAEFHLRYCDTGESLESVGFISVEVHRRWPEGPQPLCLLGGLQTYGGSWTYGDGSERCEPLGPGVYWATVPPFRAGRVGFVREADGTIRVFERTCTLPGMTPLSPPPPGLWEHPPSSDTGGGPPAASANAAPASSTASPSGDGPSSPAASTSAAP